MSLQHSPAEIIAQYLTDQSIFSATLTDDWAMFVSHLPDKPSRSGVLYDTAGTLDGRYMRDGTVVEHQGINLQVRGKSSDATTLEQKMKAAADALAAIQNATVTLDSVTYTIHNVSRISGMSSNGVANGKRRNQWTANFIVTLEEGAISVVLVDDESVANTLVDDESVPNTLVVS